MGSKAEELGVEIYPGFAASEVFLHFLGCYFSACVIVLLFTGVFLDQILYDANNKVIGIGTNDMGISKDGSKKETFQRGVEVKGSACFFLSYIHECALSQFLEKKWMP